MAGQMDTNIKGVVVTTINEGSARLRSLLWLLPIMPLKIVLNLLEFFFFFPNGEISHLMKS